MKLIRYGLGVMILSITSVIIAGELSLPDGIRHIDARRAVKKYNDRMINLDATYNKSWGKIRSDLVQELNRVTLELSQRNDPKILDQILSIREFSKQVQQMPSPLGDSGDSGKPDYAKAMELSEYLVGTTWKNEKNQSITFEETGRTTVEHKGKTWHRSWRVDGEGKLASIFYNHLLEFEMQSDTEMVTSGGDIWKRVK